MGSIVVTKTCVKCGKVEQMAARLDLCLTCRIQAKKDKIKERKAQYYFKNREKMRAYARNYYRKKQDAKPQKNFEQSRQRRMTVHFEKTEGGYCWKAYFRNPVTDRLVKFESDGYFDTIKKAREDFLEATN